MTSSFAVSGNIVDVLNEAIFPGTIEVENGKITRIVRETHDAYDTFLLPGFVDAHVHVESSMLVPSEFARLAVTQGTVATVSDPHEIANVLGVAGVEYMIANGRTVPFKFAYGAPSCVPATVFETSGATLDADAVRQLLAREDISYLSEMMDFPGVIHHAPQVLAKIHAAQVSNKPVDGHAPGLRGVDAATYFRTGISTDHECYSEAEAREKLELGVLILIREGSAAKNYEALAGLIEEFPDRCMFCSDDKHPNELARGHINALVRRAVHDGIDVMKALRVACVNPVLHYGLNVGLLREGDPADFIEVDSLENIAVQRTFINGLLVAENGSPLIPRSSASIVNHFAASSKQPADFCVAARGERIHVIEAINGQLITRKLTLPAAIRNGEVVSDIERDLLKIAVINRYEDAPPAIGFIHRFGLQRGALASSVAHDSHNIIAVGATDDELCRAVNLVIAHRGGLAVVDGAQEEILPLPVAGIMTNEDGFAVAERYEALDAMAKRLGTQLDAPFMTLSFMALLVIPALKLSDKGLFDGETFALIDLFDGS